MPERKGIGCQPLRATVPFGWKDRCRVLASRLTPFTMLWSATPIACTAARSPPTMSDRSCFASIDFFGHRPPGKQRQVHGAWRLIEHERRIPAFLVSP